MVAQDPRYRDSLLWHYTNSNDIARARMAEMYGVKDEAFRPWPGNPPPVVNNYYPPTVPDAPQTTPAAPPAKSGWLKPLALAGLVGVIGGGGMAGGGWYLADKIRNLPATIPTAPAKAQSFDIKVGFDPDKGGLQVSPPVPVKDKP